MRVKKGQIICTSFLIIAFSSVVSAAGIWIAPEYAALVMVISIGVALITSRFVKNVPFLTCMFPVFLGGQLCEVFLVY